MLQQLIAYQNIVVPGGAVTAENSRYTTRAGSQISSVEELKQIIVGMRYAPKQRRAQLRWPHSLPHLFGGYC